MGSMGMEVARVEKKRRGRKKGGEAPLPLAIRPLGLVDFQQEELYQGTYFHKLDKEKEAQAFRQPENLLLEKLQLNWKVTDEEKLGADSPEDRGEWEAEFEAAFERVRKDHRGKRQAMDRSEDEMQGKMKKVEVELEKRFARNAQLCRKIKAWDERKNLSLANLSLK